MLDRAISTKFLTHRVTFQSGHPNFQKKIFLAQNGGHFEFSNFSQKIAKHKNAYLYLGLDRAILTKFLNRRVSLQSIAIPIFKKFLSRHLEFFAKIAKHKTSYISKTVLDRAISTKFLTQRLSLQSSHPNFQKKNFSPKLVAI